MSHTANIKIKNAWIKPVKKDSRDPRKSYDTLLAAEIENTSTGDDSIQWVELPHNGVKFARVVQLHMFDRHEGYSEQNRGHMLPVANIQVPPKDVLRLGPNKPHVMFLDVDPDRFQEGSVVPLLVKFERDGIHSIEVPVGKATM